MQLMPAHHFNTIKVRHIWFNTKCYRKGYQTSLIYLTVQYPVFNATFTADKYTMYILVNPSKNLLFFRMEAKAWIIVWKLH